MNRERRPRVTDVQHARREPEAFRVLVVMTCTARLKTVRAKAAVLGFRVVVAPTCRQARVLLRRAPDIAVALTDTSLPDGNWLDVLGEAAAQSRPIPVLIVTAVNSEVLWSEALWRGAYDVLVEPFETDELDRAVDGALRSGVGSQDREPTPTVSG